jgi:hypothetical protein
MLKFTQNFYKTNEGFVQEVTAAIFSGQTNLALMKSNTVIIDVGFNLYPNPGATARPVNFARTLSAAIKLKLDSAYSLTAAGFASVAAVYCTMF